MARSMRIVFLGVALWAQGVLAGPVEDLEDADLYYESASFEQAMALYKRVAEAGDPAGQAKYAMMLEAADRGVEAVEFFRKSAESGNPDGQFGLGMMYFKGRGMPKNNDLGLEWVGKSFAQNHAKSIGFMLSAYRFGYYGIEKNPDEVSRLKALLKEVEAQDKKLYVERINRAIERDKLAKMKKATTTQGGQNASPDLTAVPAVEPAGQGK